MQLFPFCDNCLLRYNSWNVSMAIVAIISFRVLQITVCYFVTASISYNYKPNIAKIHLKAAIRWFLMFFGFVLKAFSCSTGFFLKKIIFFAVVVIVFFFGFFCRILLYIWHTKKLLLTTTKIFFCKNRTTRKQLLTAPGSKQVKTKNFAR